MDEVKGLSENTSVSFTESVGERIAARRKQLGWTQEQTAERAGLSHQFFSSVEAGKKNVRAENVVKLSRALNVSTDYILTGQSNSIDVDGIASMLQQLDEIQLRCAEEIIKNLLVACKSTK